MPTPKVKTMRHDMLDLETMGTEAGCVVLSIGVCLFDPYKAPDPDVCITDTFYSLVSTQSCLDNGLFINEDTERWWAGREPAARQVVEQAKAFNEPIRVTCERLSAWVKTKTNRLVYGNGADFDQPILKALFKAANVPWPWGPYNSRCYRTLKSLAPDTKLVRYGTYHNALDDAISQAVHLAEVVDQKGIVLL